MNESHLLRILESTRKRVDQLLEEAPIELLEVSALERGPIRDFRAAIASPGISLIAEIKRRSPSAGIISDDVDPADIAREYERGGARALSVLTEPHFFEGSLADLEEARNACSLPVLRKDFVIDPYQITEARAMGADAILLIVAAFDDAKMLGELYRMARDRGMTSLVEIHDGRELEIAMELVPEIIGINQRNLQTFEVDITLAARMRAEIPSNVLVVAESGIGTRDHVVALADAGVNAILVGESLMRSPDRTAAVASLLP